MAEKKGRSGGKGGKGRDTEKRPAKKKGDQAKGIEKNPPPKPPKRG